MSKLKLIIAIGALAFILACQSNTNRSGSSGTGTENEPTDQPVTNISYVCPMHPEVTSDQPGECPKCGMDLVATDSVKVTGEDSQAL